MDHQIRDGIVTEILPHLYESMFKVTVLNDDDGEEDEDSLHSHPSNEENANETIVTYLNHERMSYDVISNILIFPPHNYDIVSVTFDFDREFNQLLQFPCNDKDGNKTTKQSPIHENVVDQQRTDERKFESLETNAEIFYHLFKENETRVFNSDALLTRVLQMNNDIDKEVLLGNCRRLLNFHQLRKIEEEEREDAIQVMHKDIRQLEDRDIVVDLIPYSSISHSMNALDAQVHDHFYSDDEFSEFASDCGSYNVVDLLSSAGSELDSNNDDGSSNNDNGEMTKEKCFSELPFFDSRLFLNNLENLQTDKHVILRFDENSGTDFKTHINLLGSRDVEVDKKELSELEELFFLSVREKPLVKKLRDDKVLYHLLLVALCRDIGLSAIVN